MSLRLHWHAEQDFRERSRVEIYQRLRGAYEKWWCWGEKNGRVSGAGHQYKWQGWAYVTQVGTRGPPLYDWPGEQTTLTTHPALRCASNARMLACQYCAFRSPRPVFFFPSFPLCSDSFVEIFGQEDGTKQGGIKWLHLKLNRNLNPFSQSFSIFSTLLSRDMVNFFMGP